MAPPLSSQEVHRRRVVDCEDRMERMLQVLIHEELLDRTWAEYIWEGNRDQDGDSPHERQGKRFEAAQTDLARDETSGEHGDQDEEDHHERQGTRTSSRSPRRHSLASGSRQTASSRPTTRTAPTPEPPAEEPYHCQNANRDTDAFSGCKKIAEWHCTRKEGSRARPRFPSYCGPCYRWYAASEQCSLDLKKTLPI